MSNIKEIQQIKTLIAEGKKKGFLTYEELNKALPSDYTTPEQLEEIHAIFDQMDIAIVDSEEESKKLNPEKELELSDKSEDSADYASRSTDPVRMYLREMGAVPLLDREGEVVIAKKIEIGEMDVLRSEERRVGKECRL